MNPLLLWYSGTPEDAVALTNLVRQGWPVVTLTVDIGQNLSLEDVRERALSLGAVRAHVVDTREAFARDFLWPALAVGATDLAPGVTQGLVMALVARQLADMAIVEDADAVAHACVSDGDEVCLTRALGSVRPDLQVIDGLQHVGDVPHAPARRVSAARVADDLPGGSPPAAHDASSTRLHSTAGDAIMDVTFRGGHPAAVNGVPMDPVDLLMTVQTIAAAHGVAPVPRTAAAWYPQGAPAMRVLAAAQAALLRHVTPRRLDNVRRDLAVHYADCVLSGDWYSVTREAVDAFTRAILDATVADVRVTVANGRIDVTSVTPRPAAASVPASTGKDN